MKNHKKKRCSKKVITSDQLALRELRLVLNLTLKQAGLKLGLSGKGLGAIENGRVSLNRDRIEEIVTAYDVTYLDFVRRKKVIERDIIHRKRKKTVKKVLSNDERRSYQKLITKECRVLRSMRKTKSITQDRASALCGYTRATIGHIENGRIELSKERIKHIVESYGYIYSDFEVNLAKEYIRAEVLDSCIEKIHLLDDTKLNIVKNLLGSF